jgi:undecaprenyl-diphosphatase
MPGRAERWRLGRYRELLRARWSLLSALAAVALGVFAKLTSELREGELDRLDQQILDVTIAHRTPHGNGVALDITSLGSPTVLILIVVITLFFLLLARDYRDALQLLLASIGAAVWTEQLKRVIERQRPSALSRLAEVTSFSYPSGHSLASAAVYLTLALVLSRRIPWRGGRVGLFVIALTLMAAIGTSRAYLAVHFPSDIAAGLSFGAAWALLLSAIFSYGSVKAKDVEHAT